MEDENMYENDDRIIVNIGFLTTDGKEDETQVDLEAHNNILDEHIELINLLLSLKEEMDIREVIYLDYLQEE